MDKTYENTFKIEPDEKPDLEEIRNSLLLEIQGLKKLNNDNAISYPVLAWSQIWWHDAIRIQIIYFRCMQRLQLQRCCKRIAHNKDKFKDSKMFERNSPKALSINSTIFLGGKWIIKYPYCYKMVMEPRIRSSFNIGL